MNTKKNSIDMTGDRLLGNFFRFALPIMISALFQRLFNAADSVIVGRFSGAEALAAVGGTAPLVSLLTWGLMGLASGADVAVARMIGQKDPEGAHRAVHTSYFIGILSGIITMLAGFFLSGQILTWMGVPAEILSWSILYLRIYSFGLFFIVIYNFGAACLRSSGDSRRPTMFMIFSGLLNVILNLLFVCLLKWGVAGVAIATAISQFVAAFLVTATLHREQGFLHLNFREIRMDRTIAYQIVSIGLPSLMQNAMFCLSSMVVQSSINSFGSTTMAANSAATSIEDFVYIGTAGINQSCTAFTGQNNGAGKTENIRKVLWISLAGTTLLGVTIASLDNLFARPLLGMFTTNPEVVTLGIYRLRYVVLPLFLNGIVDVFACSMRGMGSSLLPMITTLVGICGFRLIYIFTVFQKIPTLPCLYLCYPLSWIVTAVFLAFFWLRHYRKFASGTMIRI